MTVTPLRHAETATQPRPGGPLSLDGHGLRLDDVISVARAVGHRIELSDQARRACAASLAVKDVLIASEQPIYGVTTGFGGSAANHVSPARTAALQRNLVTYHLNGTGQTAASAVVRATMLIRANCLARGVSGVRPLVIERILRLLAEDVLPVIPERGSVGASGDLVPLCYLAAVLQGDGEVAHAGSLRDAEEVHRELGLEPLTLAAKEGLALINGTSFMSAFAALAAADATELVFAAELASVLAVEALVGNRDHFGPFLDAQKPHPGLVASAGRIHRMLDGSRLALDQDRLLASYARLDGRDHQQLHRRVQDPYSLRCAPHVTGVLGDTLTWVRPWLTTEINSANDNPLFDAESARVHSGGNFYGGHVGQAMDSLKVAVANVADLLDRQLAVLVDERFNNGLPANLIHPAIAAAEPGMHHGYKGMQIACSSLTAEALRNSAPATVFSRSTEAHNQDKVSMGTIAARDARTVVELAVEVAAIHLHALCQALDIRGVEKAGEAARRAHAAIRAVVPPLDRDRRMDADIHILADLITSGQLRTAVDPD